MRRTTDRDDPERGLSAALKALTVVAAVALLALVAGKSAYTTGAATETAPTYRLLHPAPGDTPRMGATVRNDLSLDGAGIVPPEMHGRETPPRAGSSAAPDEPPMTRF